MNPFKKLPAPAWFLILVTPLVIESCITAATPPLLWLNPGIALLLILAYGPPILFLREVWIRKALPLRSLFLLGLAYGFLNEGIIAHTITQVSGEPITHFIGYDEAFGMHWAWTSLIVPWHAFFSVTCMVLLTHLWFAEHAGTPWLGKHGMYIAGTLSLLILPLYFILNTQARPAPMHAFPIYITLMAFCYWCAVRQRALACAPALPPSRRTLILTAVMALLVPSIITIAGFELAHHKLPLAGYFAFTLGITGLILLLFGKAHPHRLLAFMLGGTIGLCGFAVLIARNPLYLLVAPVFLVFIFVSMKKLIKAAQLQEGVK